MPSLRSLMSLFVLAVLSLLPMAAFVTALQASPKGPLPPDRALGGPVREWDADQAPPVVVTSVPDGDAGRLPEEPAIQEPSPDLLTEQEVAKLHREECADREIAMLEAAMVGMQPCERPVRLTSGDLVVAIAPWPHPSDPHYRPPEITIRRGREAPFVVRPTESTWGHSVTVGRLDRSGARYVMIQGYTGGFHCCVTVEIALPDAPHRHLVAIGSFQAGYEVRMDDPAPQDVDGDGTTDFVGHDNRFFYEFTSYGGTHPPPPRIWNIRDGRAIDVSGERRYRSLFAESAATARAACFAGEEGQEDRSACATYAASAARLGGYGRAWREMRRAISPKRGDIWGNPYLDHLRQFLRVSGYLGPTNGSQADDFAHTITFPGEHQR